jgi:hypothetical protein
MSEKQQNQSDLKKKLIKVAEFMDNKPHQDERYGEMWQDPTANNAYRHGLKYHSDWNWLLLVVNKINDITISHFSNSYESIFEEIMVRIPALQITEAFELCVEFIDLYNLEKQLKS